MTGVISSQSVVPVLLLTVHGHVHHVDRSEYRSWGPPWLPVLPEGSSAPWARQKHTAGGSDAFDDAAGAQARRRDVVRDAYRAVTPKF
jgi:hypothetical protein